MTKRELRLLEGAALTTFVVVIVGVFLLASGQRILIGSNQMAAVVTAVLVDLANGDRGANTIGGLTVNPTLVAAAQAKADDMAAKGYFAHVSPDGRDSWYWFKQAGYNFSYAGENLAVDFSDSSDVERAWMNSPAHRENILNGHFTEIGIATAIGSFQGHQTTFVVQMFGAPATTRTKAAAPIQRVTAPTNATDIAVAQREPAVRAVVQPRRPIATTTARTRVLGAEAGQPIGVITRNATVWERFMASPKTMLRYAYYLVGVLVLLALAATTGFEFRVHHRKKFVTAGALLVLMFGLFVAADYFLFAKPVLAISAAL